MTFQEWFDSTGPWSGDSRDMEDAWNAAIANNQMTDADLGKLWNVARYQGSWDAFVHTARALESSVLAERKPIYQARTIGSRLADTWTDQSKDGFDHMAKYPTCFETRIVFTHPTPDDAARYPHAAIGAALIASGLYDRMRDITGGDREARKLIEELIATVDPVLDRWHSAAIDRARQSGEEN